MLSEAFEPLVAGVVTGPTVPSGTVSDEPGPRRLTLRTDDDVRLDAELALPPTGGDGESAPVGGVVLAHPHPLQGGSMTSLVTAELFRVLPTRGLAAIRFDFRGVGASGGTHDQGRGEQLDVTAALDTLAAACPGRPLVLCGWSFGADVSLAVTDPRVDAWVAVAPPLRVLPLEVLGAAAGSDPRPTVLAVPQHDQFRPPADAREATADWVATRVEVISGADHFMAGRTDRVAALVVEVVASLGG